MARSIIAEEIQQTKPFQTIQDEVYVSLMRTADLLKSTVTAALKPFGISATQYNVLRILRGAEPNGHRCSAIGDRLITHEPDITRLLDRLDKAGLIVRNRNTDDRRVVITRITSQGLKLLKEVDKPLADAGRRRLAHMTDKKLKSLLALLDEVRHSDE